MSMAYFFAPPPAWHGATIDLDGGETCMFCASRQERKSG